MGANELSTLDRTTLRVWRVTNLLGWGAAAAITFILVMAGFIVLWQAADVGEVRGWIGIPLLIVQLGIAAAAAGLVGGGHLYRAPGIVTFVGVWLVSMFFLLAGMVGNDISFLLIGGAIASAVAGAAALVARWRWRRRPRALRA